MSRFWLDANVLIEANNGPYPYGTAVTFWQRMAEQIELGNIVSPRRVYKELAEHQDHQDEVAKFVRNRRDKGLCIRPNRKVMGTVGMIEVYVFSKYEMAHAWRFSRGGDPWIIAHAFVDNGTVCTRESALRSEAKVARIPDICKHFGVQCVDTMGMFKILGVQF